jgi:hypothetical protein
MNARNSTSRRNITPSHDDAEECASTCAHAQKNKTRKKREELSISATKSIKKETVDIVVSFN